MVGHSMEQFISLLKQSGVNSIEQFAAMTEDHITSKEIFIQSL